MLSHGYGMTWTLYLWRVEGQSQHSPGAGHASVRPTAAKTHGHCLFGNLVSLFRACSGGALPTLELETAKTTNGGYPGCFLINCYSRVLESPLERASRSGTIPQGLTHQLRDGVVTCTFRKEAFPMFSQQLDSKCLCHLKQLEEKQGFSARATGILFNIKIYSRTF